MAQTKVTDDVREVTEVDAAKITTGTIPEARITSLAASKLTGTVDNARISLDAAEIPNLAASKITTGELANDRVAALPASKITSGTVDVARLPSTVLNSNIDLTAVKQDIAMLALYNAVSDNRAAYNLPNSFIDQFEDDTGTTTRTDVSNISEYFASVSSAVGAFPNDSDTLLLIHSDTTHNSVTFTDSSSNNHTIGYTGNARHRSHANITEGAKIGGTSIYFDGSGDSLTFPDHSMFDFGTADFTIEAWMSFNSNPATNNIPMLWANASWASNNLVVRTQASGPRWEYYIYGGGAHHVTRTIPQTAWHHYAVVKASGGIKMFYDGTEESYSQSTAGAENISGDAPRIGLNAWAGFNGYIDEFRVSDTARYSSTFTPNEITTVSATGTLISDQQTAPALTKMSGVVLVKDGGSSATVMGTHLKIYFCATGTAASFPSAWVEAASYTAVTAPFSTGVTMYKLGETTVPSGTSPTIRAVWASQTDGGYESQLHGWAMNY